MTNDAQRIFRLEGLVRTLSQQVLALQVALAQTAQNQATAGVAGGGSSGGSSGAFRVRGIQHAANIAPGGSQVFLVDQLSGGFWVPTGTATIWNGLAADSTTAGLTLIVEPVGDGSYLVISQGCSG